MSQAAPLRLRGVDRVAAIDAALAQHPNFWLSLDRALDRIGLTEEYARESPPVAGVRGKSIKDSVWGMMDFVPDEMALIDGPLLQRLRAIKQLGFTYLTYPSADHSRFAHTLGVAHIVKRLLNAIEETVRREGQFTAGGETYPLYSTEPPAEAELKRCLIHAALLHDCGHVAFSHAGEGAFKALGDAAKIGGIPLEKFRQIFRDNGFQNSDLSECLSVVICLSPRFSSYYQRLLGCRVEDCRRWIYTICCFIGGVPHVPDHPGLANIISGAVVDADKIDYVNRDAKNCGIPVGIDVSRIFLHTSLVRISLDQARKIDGLTGHAVTLTHPGVHFIVNSTGIDTYDEVTIAKRYSTIVSICTSLRETWSSS